MDSDPSAGNIWMQPYRPLQREVGGQVRRLLKVLLTPTPDVDVRPSDSRGAFSARAHVRSRGEIIALRIPIHAKQLVLAAWRAGSADGLERARRWAHQFGYGGHTLTKSREYSVTLTALRTARAAWRAGCSEPGST